MNLHLNLLTPKEKEVLSLVGEGLTSEQIADKLKLSKRTVDTHRHRIISSLGLSSVSELIKNRRATPPRLFMKKAISKEIIEQLLENANWAPNHKKTEPWRFKIYTGESKLELAKKAYEILKEKQEDGYPVAPEKVEKFKSTLERVPVAVAIIVQLDSSKRLPEWEEIAATSMAVQNMWLTATEMGLGAFWATPAFIELFYELLKLKPGQKCLGFFYVGEIMMDYPSPGRGDIESKVEWKN